MAAKKTTHEPAKPADEIVNGDPADLPPADDFSTSGAPRQITDFDPEHPAVDNNPRAKTSVVQNQIDFNDPDLDSAKAVEKELREQGSSKIA